MTWITMEYIDNAIRCAENGQPWSDVPDIKGLSSDNVRRLLNNLCAHEDAHYLEVGVYYGSTFIPAIYNRQCIAQCVDNWSQFYGSRTVFEDNLQAHDISMRWVKIVEGDLFTLDVRQLWNGVNVYFYDGPHTADGHFQAFTRFHPIFADRFIAIVDDWHWTPEPCEWTFKAWSYLGYRVEHLRTLPTNTYNDADSWWNGLMVAIVNKE